MRQRAVVISPTDNVATAISHLKAGSTVQVDAGGQRLELALRDDIRFGHKFSLARIEAGAPVVKYGEVIGTATKVIEPGEHVHVHNVASTRGRGDLAKEGR